MDSGDKLISHSQATKPLDMVLMRTLDMYMEKGARGSVVCWGTMLQAGRSSVRFPDKMDVFQFT
jgi:hypothetical protein